MKFERFKKGNLLRFWIKRQKKSFVLRIVSYTMESPEKWAADEFRSANGQILFIHDQALKKNGRLPKNKRGLNKEATVE